MLLILKSADGSARVIHGVTHVHHRAGMFGWFRAANPLGIGFPENWIKKRFQDIVVVDKDELWFPFGNREAGDE